MLELAVQQASSVRKLPMMTPSYAILEHRTLVLLERPRMIAQIAQQVNGVLQDQPAKLVLAPALMALTAPQERSILMSMGALPARHRLAQATQPNRLTALTALSARGAVRALKRQPCAVLKDTYAQLDRRPEATVTLESILPVLVQNQLQDRLVTAVLLVTTVRASQAKKSANQVIIHQEEQKTAPQLMQASTLMPFKLPVRQLLVVESGPLLVILRSVTVLEAVIALVVSRQHVAKVNSALWELARRLLLALVCK